MTDHVLKVLTTTSWSVGFLGFGLLTTFDQTSAGLSTPTLHFENAERGKKEKTRIFVLR